MNRAVPLQRGLGSLVTLLVIVAVVIGGVGGFVEVASAQTLTVDDDGSSDHDGIQAAIDAANTGDTIKVKPGTYDESPKIDKDRITLRGPNNGTSATESRHSEATIRGTVSIDGASGVTVDGFKIAEGGSELTSGVSIQPKSSGAEGITVNNSIIENMSKAGGGGSSDFTFGVLSFGGNLSDVTISDNQIANVGDPGGTQGVAVSLENLTGTTAGSGATIERNTIRNISSISSQQTQRPGTGIALRPNFKGNNSAADIGSNSFAELEIAVSHPQGDTATVDRTELATVVVDDPNQNQQRIFTPTVQDAVAAAGQDAVVEVGPGNYAESVTIDEKGLTLEGPNAGTPGDGDRGPEATIKQGLEITADDVRIDGVEVTNDDTNGILLGSAPSEVVVTNTVVRDITGDVGGSKAAGNGINLQFTGAFEQTSTGIEITNNLIRDISTPDNDGGDADAIGVQLLPRGNDVKNLLIRDNVIADIQPGTASDGRSEARAISIDTQFTDTSGGNRGDSGQATNLNISDNEVDNLTADFARAIALFEDKNGDTQSDTNLGPTDFEITGNIVSDVSSQSDEFASLSIFVGEYPEFGAEHAVRQNILLAGVGNFGGSSDTLQATNNWWGATNGPSGSFGGDGVGAGGNGDITVDPVSVSGGSADLATPFVGTISDPASELRTVADSDAGFTIEKIGAPADGTLVLEIAGTEYVFEDALDRGNLTSTTSENAPTAISDTATTGQRSISVVGNDSTTALDETGTVRLVHEVQGIGSGYTLSSVPQPARIYTHNVSDITAWDNENGNFESTTATVDDGTLVTDAEALHNGQYFFGDAADARVGYDYLEDDESAIQVGAAGFETLDEGFHLIGSNYDTSSSDAPVSLDRDLATVKSLPDKPGNYDGSESFVAYSVDGFAELGGNKDIGSFEAYWVYVDVGEDSETRVIKLARFNPSDA
jgi:hypothetical protein